MSASPLEIIPARARPVAIDISGLTKVYDNGFTALGGIDLKIFSGEIFALLGPNGAGKTTLISIICGIVKASAGSVTALGHDVTRDYLAARRTIGLVPQELSTDAFESVLATVTFSRGLFGCAPNPALIEKILRDLTLWDKRHNKIVTLSGGMKRRLMIAKALSHEPRILFLDEPTAGVDVELRRDMWEMVRQLKDSGVTILLTTHYIEEAEQMADRIGVINKGNIVVVDEKAALMQKLGKAHLCVELKAPLAAVPHELSNWQVSLSQDGKTLSYSYDIASESNGITTLLRQIDALGLEVKNLETRQSSLEEIFVQLLESAA